jgi:hypothetical protein
MLLDALIRVIIQSLTFTLSSFLSNVVVFLGLGLQGRFGYIFGVQCLMLQVCVAIGSFMGCITKNPMASKEFIPIVLILNLLLSGYFVNSEDLPDYIRWAQWIVPLPYAFRLFLNEEFAVCLEPPPDDLDPSEQEVLAFCQEYLEVQDADGRKNLQYWFTLLGLFLGFRALWLCLLHWQATMRQ